MRIEAVTVCVGYADFLAAAAPHNRGLLDRWLVVTSPEDEQTREVCRRFCLDTLLTAEGTRDGQFRKGWLVERGLQQLSADAWHLHLDGDIVMPAYARRLLEAADLDPAKVYGCDRLMARSWAEWQAVLASGWLGSYYAWGCNLTPPPGLALGTRWASPTAGWVPIGFWQLSHPQATEWHGVRARPYPYRHGNACRTDVQYGLQWDRRDRVLIPELLVVHLESEPAPMGANWDGRTTAPFGPPSQAHATVGVS